MRGVKVLAASAALAGVPAAAGGGGMSVVLPIFALCAGGESALLQAEAPAPQLVEGLGYSGIDPGTKNALARQWFDQGIRFVWGFDEAEGIRAFKMAQSLDPNCAMCFWGEAWARSPTINLSGRAEEFKDAKAASDKARSLSNGLSPNQLALIEAMRVRTAGADAFDGQSYADFMEQAAARHPQDDAIAVLAADAKMQMFRGDTMPKGTLQQQLLERVLARSPNHSGAIHFYIHLTDWLGAEKLAEPHANRLAGIAPGLSHLVHMPSHTFYGVGRYRDAMEANLAALSVEKSYELKVNPPGTAYRAGLNRHNTNFAIGSALMIGDGVNAIKTADYFLDLYAKKTNDTGAQFARASIYFAYGLHGDPKKVMELATPSEKTPLLQAMRHYARGEALARQGDAGALLREAATISGARAKTVLPPQTAQWGNAMMQMAQHVLEGRAAMLRGQPKVAEKAYRKAMKHQKLAAFSSDPPTWWYPVRRSVAASLIAQRDYRGARNQLLKSLEGWPNDPIALHLLSITEGRLGNVEAANMYAAQARSGWKGNLSQVKLPMA